MEVKLLAFLTSAVDGGEWLVLSGRFDLSGEKIPEYRSRFGHSGGKEKNPCPCDRRTRRMNCAASWRQK
jgi:hypothetical protein